MIFELMIDVLVGLINEGLDLAYMVEIPVDGIQVLAQFCAYGSYVVGSDLLLIFSSCILGWMGIKLVLGLVLFVWRLLPFT